MATRKTAEAKIDAIAALRAELDLAELKAWESLARYKFQMFGYWAAIWVHQNRLMARITGAKSLPNPWACFAKQAQGMMRAIAILETEEGGQ
jgi:hypothetical protein